MWDPNRLASEPTKSNLDRICLLLRELYTFTTGNEYITLGLPPQVTQDPAGTPAINTLYKALIPKAWIRFNMATDAIADSFNVSSITDGIAGVDTVNLDRDMAADTYTVVPGKEDLGGTGGEIGADSYAVGSFRLVARSLAGVLTDATLATAIAFGDQ